MSRAAGAFLLLLGCLGCRHDSGAPIHVYDGFDAPALSEIWERSRLEPGAVVIQSRVVRAGQGAARIVLRPGDRFERGVRGDADSERDELSEADRLISREDVPYAYDFSILLPRGFPLARTRLVLAQWKQRCGASPCSNDSPVLAVRYAGGVLGITRTVGPRRDTLFRTGDDPRGRWLDFRFRIRFSATPRGRVQTWLNDRQVVDFSGPTAYPENATTGYRSPGRFYFKMGLYRDLMAVPETLYVDEYRKLQLPDSTLSRRE